MCCKNPLTLALDQLLAFCLIGPLVVSYWRSAFNIFDIYMLPGHPTTSTWISLGVGNIGMALLPLFKWIIRQIVTKDLSCWSLRRMLGISIFIYVAGFIEVSRFRGGWNILDQYAGNSLQAAICTVSAATVGLLLLRGYKNCTSVPFATSVDVDPEVLEDQTRFNVAVSSPIRYALDCILSVGIIRNLEVAFWKGCWVLLDRLLYPDDVAASIVVSLFGVGLSLVIMYPVQIIILQFQASIRKRLILSIVLDDLVFSVANVGTVMYWRAIWNSLDAYVFSPDKPLVSNWVTWVVSVVGTSLLCSSASYATKPFYVDGRTLEEDTSAVFDNKYIRFFLEQRSASDDNNDGDEMTPLTPK